MNNSSLTWGTHISRQFTSIPWNGSPTVVRWVGFYVHVCVTRGATLEVAQFYGKRPREKWKRRDESLKNRVEKERGKKKEKKGSSFRFYISWALLTFIFFTPLHSTPLDFACPLRLRQFIFSRYFDSLFPALLTTSNAQLSWRVGLFLNASQVLGLENRKDELLYYLVVQTLPCIIIIAQHAVNCKFRQLSRKWY